MPDNVLAFSKLPSELQARLIELQTPSPDRFVFLKTPSILNYLAIAAGIGWVAYMFTATADYLWENWMIGVFTAVTLILVTLALWSLSTIVRAFSGKTRDGWVFTRDECVSYRGDRIGFRSLKELESFQFLEHINTIEIWIGDVVEKIKVRDASEAVKLDSVFLDWQNSSGEPFLTPCRKAEMLFNPLARRTVTVGLLLGFVLLAAGLSYSATRLNRSYDDDQSWKRSENGETVADVVAYKTRHPNGNHLADADRKIAELIVRAKEDYTKNIKASANQAAVASLSRLLDEMNSNPDRKVYVKFTEVRELDDAVVKKMKSNTGLSISSYDFTIPTTALQYRREKILNDVSVLFLPATRSASVNFELADDPPPGTPVVEIRSVMKSIEFFYRYDWWSGGSSTTYYNPGAKFEFDFELRPSDTSKAFKTQYVSQFTRGLNTGLIDQRDAANYSFDKLFFSSVSEDFAKFLQREFGFIE